MKTPAKVILGFSALAILIGWSLTTKNEVVESLVFPLKLKFGMAKEQDAKIPPSMAGMVKN